MPATIDRRHKPGDKILKIGDHAFDNLTQDQAMKVLMETRIPSDGGEQKASKYKHIHCI